MSELSSKAKKLFDEFNYSQTVYFAYSVSGMDNDYIEMKRKTRDAKRESFKEYVVGLESRIAELERLRPIVDHVEQLQAEAVLAKRDAKNDARRERLKDLMGEYTKTHWAIDDVPFEREKCDLCDDRRMLVHTFPNGKKAEVYCKCKGYGYFYKPVEVQVAEIRMESDGRGEFYTRMAFRDAGEDKRNRGNRLENVYQEQMVDGEADFEELDARRATHTLVFKTQEQAQAYCDWRNMKEREE